MPNRRIPTFLLSAWQSSNHQRRDWLWTRSTTGSANSSRITDRINSDGKTPSAIPCRSTTASCAYRDRQTRQGKARTGPCTLTPVTCSKTAATCVARSVSSAKRRRRHQQRKIRMGKLWKLKGRKKRWRSRQSSLLANHLYLLRVTPQHSIQIYYQCPIQPPKHLFLPIFLSILLTHTLCFLLRLQISQHTPWVSRSQQCPPLTCSLCHQPLWKPACTVNQHPKTPFLSHDLWTYSTARPLWATRFTARQIPIPTSPHMLETPFTILDLACVLLLFWVPPDHPSVAYKGY